MRSNADSDQLQRLCGNDETISLARTLVPLAKARTKQGSGHHFSGLATSLPAICAYIASQQLNNNDVSLEAARQASCLKPNDFKKAHKTLCIVLEPELISKKGKREITYDVLHERCNLELPFSSLMKLLQRVEQSFVLLETQYQVDSSDVRSAIFFWVCSTIDVKDLPSLDEFAQANALLSKRLAPVIKLLNDKCSSLKKAVLKEAKNPSRPSSPRKSLIQPSTPRTPRRSPTKPLRELPTRESVKKQREAQALSTESNPPKRSEDTDPADVNMAPPETPIKKRKLDVSSPTSPPTKKRLAFPPVTPSATHIIHLTSPQKNKVNPTPTIPSPLRQSARFVLQQEADDAMNVDDDDDVPIDVNRSLEVDLAKVGGEDDDAREEQLLVTRRFRPVYQDMKQWFARDAKVLRMWREANEAPVPT
ncbi:hypothetical protein AN958_04534 [Leucoagaricus sp. SymC.cos]|nr:hypothetical protein AN958_04534 [Leucoagaricus sp. SymC.cos]